MSNAQTSRVLITDLAAMKVAGKKWAMLTCYEQMTAQIFDEAGIPVLLVGDSAGNNFLGHENTIPVTVDELIPMAKAVVNSSKKAMVIADFPFGSYEEAKVGAVKLEGGAKVVPAIKKLVAAGIPVMGHLGLTPQSVHALGGFKVQGRGDDGGEILNDAKALELAGVFAIVLEAIPAQLAEQITKSISIPTIGIGAGSGCDGQVLVWTDLVGITEKIPKLAKAYRNLRKEIADAATEFARDVANGDFPGKEQSFS